MAERKVYIDERAVAEAAERNAKLKQSGESWPEYINKKLAPVLEGIGAGASSATRALGPLKGPLDDVMHPAAAQIRTWAGTPTTPEENKARVQGREKANPEASEAGYKIGNMGRDAYLALNPYTRAAAMGNRAYNWAFGGGLGAESQAFEEYDRAVNRNMPVEPFEQGERMIAATTGGAAGAATGGKIAKHTPLARDMSSIPGAPLTAAQTTALARAEQLARQHGDTAPDLAQLMRLSGDEQLFRRAADVEGMYRRAKPLVISESDIAKYATPDGGNRLIGRLTTPPKDGRAEVAPEVLRQLDKRNAPGGFNAQIDVAAADLGTSQLALERILNTPPKRGPRVDAVTPPPGAVPPRVLRERDKLYKQDVEAERRQPHNTYLTEPEAKQQVGSPEQMRFWDATLERLPPHERAILEDVLGTIRGARPGQPGSAVGKGPAQVGPAIQDRTNAQRALNQYGDVQKSIGESFPYKPSEPPQLIITPPAFTKGFKVGLGLPNMGSGATSRGTTKAFKDPTTAGSDIGRMSPAELFAAFIGGQIGGNAAPVIWEGQRKHAR